MDIVQTTKAQRPRIFMMKNKKKQRQQPFFSSKANNTAETLENNWMSNKNRLNQTQAPVQKNSQKSSKRGSPYSNRKSSDKYKNSKDRIIKNPNVKFNYIPFD